MFPSLGPPISHPYVVREIIGILHAGIVKDERKILLLFMTIVYYLRSTLLICLYTV